MNTQIARIIFLNTLSAMKSILSLLEFKLGKKSPEYLYMKKQVMSDIYRNLKKTFKTLEENKILKICPKKCSLRKGYSDCSCGGSGYLNAKE